MSSKSEEKEEREQKFKEDLRGILSLKPDSLKKLVEEAQKKIHSPQAPNGSYYSLPKGEDFAHFAMDSEKKELIYYPGYYPGKAKTEIEVLIEKDCYENKIIPYSNRNRFICELRNRIFEGTLFFNVPGYKFPLFTVTLDSTNIDDFEGCLKKMVFEEKFLPLPEGKIFQEHYAGILL